MNENTPTPFSDAHAVKWTDVNTDTWYVPRIHARDLERQLNELRKPTPVCSACNWVNVGCLNLGETGGEPLWVCHSCIRKTDNQVKRLQAALHEIANYDEEPIWSDDRDDAADQMLTIAARALEPLPAKWRCRRCGAVVKDGRCQCEKSPSPWEPV